MRFLKAKLRVMQEELDRLSSELSAKVCHTHSVTTSVIALCHSREILVFLSGLLYELITHCSLHNIEFSSLTPKPTSNAHVWCSTFGQYMIQPQRRHVRGHVSLAACRIPPTFPASCLVNTARHIVAASHVLDFIQSLIQL